ncbi:MAG: zinc ribbon domain-containing protein [Streptosporangiaceae bacterium]|jgi:hypothetical protein
MSIFCSACGSPLSADDAFCGSCGYAVPSGYVPVSDTPAGSLADAVAWPSSPLAESPDQVPPAPPGQPYVRPLSYTSLTGEPAFDPLRNTRVFWQLARQALLFAVIYVLIEVVVSIILFAIVGPLAGRFAVPRSIWVEVSTLAWLIMFTAFWLTPVPALLAQWSRLVSYGATAAPTMLDYIRQVLLRHGRRTTPSNNGELHRPAKGYGTTFSCAAGYSLASWAAFRTVRTCTWAGHSGFDCPRSGWS